MAQENFPCDSTVIWEDALGTSLVPPPMALSLRLCCWPLCVLCPLLCVGILWPWPHGPPFSRGWWLPVSGALHRAHVRGSGSRLGFCSAARSPGLVGPLGSSHMPFCHHRLLLGSVETAPRGALRPPGVGESSRPRVLDSALPSLPPSLVCFVSCVSAAQMSQTMSCSFPSQQGPSAASLLRRGGSLRQISDGGQCPPRVSGFVTLLYPRCLTFVSCPEFIVVLRRMEGGGWNRRGCSPALPQFSSTADGPSCPMAWAGWCQGGLSQLAWAVGEGVPVTSPAPAPVTPLLRQS